MTAVLANIALVVAAVGALTFVVAYQVLADWRKSPIGRNVMAFMAVTLLLLTLGIIRNFVPWLNDHLDVIRIFAYSVVAFIIWRRVWLLVRAQRTEEERTRQ